MLIKKARKPTSLGEITKYRGSGARKPDRRLQNESSHGMANG
jgi:hypothetical protein